MSDALAQTTDKGLATFAKAVFAQGSWYDAMRVLAKRRDWPRRSEALLRDSEVDACARRYAPKPRLVLEELLMRLGASGGASALPRLAHIARAHPQRELRVRALHGLFLAGPGGVALAAGPPGDPPADSDPGAREMRARAALIRGDAVEVAMRGGDARKRAVLQALAGGFHPRGATLVPSARLLARKEWLAAVIDALVDPKLAEHAQAVLQHVPKHRWQPIVLAGKRAAKAPKKRQVASTGQRQKLDAELTTMRAELEALVARLEHEKYAFRWKRALSKPTKGFDGKLAALEARVGTVPLALARFWAIVGAVDLRGNHPAWQKKTWVTRGTDPHWLADPLVVASLDDALATAERSEHDVREAPSTLRYALDLAGDDLTKANFSGNVVAVETPSSAIDPKLIGRRGTLLSMLRESIAWRGFPGFAKVKDRPFTIEKGKRPRRR